MKKILYGISGIGTGHSNRQLPIIEYLSRNNKLVILAYEESYKIYASRFRNNKNVNLVKIQIPFIVGNKSGLDFHATINHPRNKNIDFLKINCKALDNVGKIIGKPDLVISDYEPLSALYAYSFNSPFITFDQQSKYLAGNFQKELAGQSCKDEIMRLRMFFPKATKRIACSFFNVEKLKNQEEVMLVPPTIKNEIIKISRKPSQNIKIIVYLSSQRDFGQSMQEIVKVLSSFKVEFHIFLKDITNCKSKANIKFYAHGNPKFYELLSECNGIISTAGHMLLSEAMYLNIPVYAMPLKVYEQQMNAFIINHNHFGLSFPLVKKEKVSYFINNLNNFSNNIRKDKKVLIRGSGQKIILDYLKKNFL